MSKRDTHKYHLKRGKKIIRSGITNDLDRREKEHPRDYGKDVHIHKVGRRTTREGAKVSNAAWKLKNKEINRFPFSTAY